MHASPPRGGQGLRQSHLPLDHQLLMSAMALAGLRCFGQALAQFMMVWQR